MPHGGLTVEQLIAAGASVEAIQHAMQEGTFPGAGEGTTTDEQAQALIDYLAGLVVDPPEGPEGPGGPGGPGGPEGAEGTDTSVTGQTDINRDSIINEIQDFVTQRSLTQFVDIPTADEFLDNFQVGFTTYIGGLVDAGELSSSDAQIARENSNFFLNDYLAELGSRAAAGENIFKVVGVPGGGSFQDALEQARLTEDLGTRPGGTTVVETTAEGTVAEETTEQVVGTQTQVTDGVPSTVARDTEETVVSTTATTGQTTSVTEDIEQIVSRPNLAVVNILSPIDFLNQKFPSAGALATTIRGRFGTASSQALRARSGSPLATGTRRV